MHLTGLVLLAPHLTEENAELLFTEASGKSRREIELVLARRFPRPDVPPKIQPLKQSPADGSGGCSDTASGPRPQNLRSGAEPYRLEPLSTERTRSWLPFAGTAGRALRSSLPVTRFFRADPTTKKPWRALRAGIPCGSFSASDYSWQCCVQSALGLGFDVNAMRRK
jgi:hypothetical protein